MHCDHLDPSHTDEPGSFRYMKNLAHTAKSFKKAEPFGFGLYPVGQISGYGALGQGPG